MFARTSALTFALLGLFPAVASAQAPAGWEDSGDEAETETPVEPEPTTPPPAPEPAIAKSPAPLPVKATSPNSAPPKTQTEEEHGSCWHCGWRRPEHSFGVWIGPGRLKFDGLSQRLQQFGYDPLSEHALDIGLGGTTIVGDGLVLGLGFNYARTSKTGGPNGAELRAHSAHLYGMVGITLARSRRWLVYPALLVGGYKAGVDIDASGAASFDQVAQSPGRSTDLEEHGWFVGGVLAIDRRFSWSRDPNRYTSLGLRMGVLQSVSSSGWRFGNDAAGGGPNTLPRVNFIAVSLGFGRYGGLH